MMITIDNDHVTSGEVVRLRKIDLEGIAVPPTARLKEIDGIDIDR